MQNSIDGVYYQEQEQTNEDVLLRASPDCVFRLSRRPDFENAQGARARLLVRVWLTRGWYSFGRDRTRRVQALGACFRFIFSRHQRIGTRYFSREVFLSSFSRSSEEQLARDRNKNARTRDRGKSSFDAFFRSFLLSFKTEEEAGINCPPFFPHLSVLGGRPFLDFLRFFFQD